MPSGASVLKRGLMPVMGRAFCGVWMPQHGFKTRCSTLMPNGIAFMPGSLCQTIIYVEFHINNVMCSS